METLEKLPHQYVTPEELDTLPKNENKKIFIVVLEAKDLVKKKT